MGLDMIYTAGEVGLQPRRAFEAAAGALFEWGAAVQGLAHLSGEELARESVLGRRGEGLAAAQ
jgi:hypothetical protein